MNKFHNFDLDDFDHNDSIQVGKHAMLTVVISDTGTGFNKEQREKVFNEVFQFKPEVLQGGGGR